MGPDGRDGGSRGVHRAAVDHHAAHTQGVPFLDGVPALYLSAPRI